MHRLLHTRNTDSTATLPAKLFDETPKTGSTALGPFIFLLLENNYVIPTGYTIKTLVSILSCFKLPKMLY